MKNQRLLKLTGGIFMMLLLGLSSAHAQLSYCIPAPASNCNLDDEITNVTFAGINNNSTCTSGYGNYYALTPGSVLAGLSYPVSVTVGDGGNEAIGAWIDYDQDSVFESSEYTYIGNVTGGVITNTIMVPASAMAGTTHMRIRSFYVANGDPETIYDLTPNSSCDAISTNFGETEDYVITIAPATACAGVPATLTASSSETSACASTSISLSSANIAEGGISYQWESSTDGGTNWANLGTAQITSSYTVSGQAEETQYRVTATCVNGGATVTSNVITVTQNAIAACLCQPLLDCTDNDMITNVTFGSINNNSTCGTDGYSSYTASTTTALLTTQTYPISVTVDDGWQFESVSVWIDYNHNGTFESSEFTYVGTGSASVVSGSITIPATAMAGDAVMRVRVAAADEIDATDDLACDEEQEYGETEDYTVAITIFISPIDEVIVSTQGGVPAVISSPTGTLQLEAEVLPVTESQDVTWSISNGTGSATISATGLVTGQTIGTVWAVAVSNVDDTKMDSIEITINPVTIDSVVVTTLGNVPAVITTPTGTLQAVATVYPLTANQAVTWSIINVTGSATISASGLVTGQTAGNVWAKAVSVGNTAKKDSILITINPIVVDSVVVTTLGNVPAVIATPTGTLQVQAAVYPLTVSQAVIWSIVNVTGSATISATGLVTGQTAGSVWAKAVSVQNTAKKDSILITINPLVVVTSVDVTTQGGVTAAITTQGGTLQLHAQVNPTSLSQSVTWSIINVSGSATISATGLVTAQTNGTVWGKAVSVANPAKADSILITITNQDLGVDNVLSDAELTVFPNPASDIVTLKSGNKHDAMTVYVTDAAGKVLFSGAVKANELNTGLAIDLSTFSPGMYLVRLEGANASVTKSIVRR